MGAGADTCRQAQDRQRTGCCMPGIASLGKERPMKSLCLSCLVVTAGVVATAAGAGRPTGAETAPPEGLYDRIAWAYMDGQWEELASALTAANRSGASLTPPQRADVAYVREALAECRPAWWLSCKSERKTAIRQMLWGKPFLATFDPTAKDGMNIRFAPSPRVLTLKWNGTEMDSRDKGEYGFLHGDMVNVSTWGTLGTAQVYALVPMDTLRSTDERSQLRLQRFLRFRSNVTSLYHSGPPGRRYALHIYLAAFLDKYGKGPLAGCRRAVGAMLLCELLKEPSRYPSLALPKSLAAEDAEKQLGRHFKFRIGRNNHWTIAEDRSYREALKAFVGANSNVLDTESVILPNGLAFSLDDEKDASLRPKRDAWIKSRFDAARGE